MILVRKLTLCQYLIFALLLSGPSLCLHSISAAVTARKDDAPAADQAATTNVAGWFWISGVGGLIQTTSG
jgi:hypothetical protein